MWKCHTNPFVQIYLLAYESFGQVASVLLHVPGSRVVINKNICEHFAGHIGHCIYEGLYKGNNWHATPPAEGARKGMVDVLKKLKVSVPDRPGVSFADSCHAQDNELPDEMPPASVIVITLHG